MFSLCLLGTVSLEGPAGPLTDRTVQRRQLALLAVLAACRDKGISRDKLIGLLWPETQQERALHLLADSVYVLRRGLGADTVVSVGDLLRLDRELVRSDLESFETRVEAGDLAGAVDVYGGPFLDGVYLADGGELERWVESERQRLAHRYAQALGSLARQSEEAGDPVAAVSWWRRLAVHDPYDSSVVVRLMSALARAGDPGNALVVGRDHARRLEAELGMEAPRELLDLAERLRAAESALRSGIDPRVVPDTGPTGTDGEPSAVSPPQDTTETDRRPTRRTILAGLIAGTALAAVGGTVLLTNNGDGSPQPSQPEFRQLTSVGDVRRSVISPDGQFLAYVAGEPGQMRLMVQDINSGYAVERATASNFYSLEWSPDGSQLLFGRSAADGPRLYVMPRVGGSPRAIETETSSLARWDGQRVLFWSDSPEPRSVWVVDPSTWQWERFQLTSPGDVLLDADWWPQDDLLAFVTQSHADGRTWLHVTDLTRGRDLLVHEQDWPPVRTPRWAPTGDAIYYLRTNDSVRVGELWRMPVPIDAGAETPEPVRLLGGLYSGGRALQSGVWSLTSDGRRMVYPRSTIYTDIWLLSLGRRGAGRQVATTKLMAETAHMSLVGIAPDGEWFAFHRQSQRGGDLFRRPLAGGPETRLTFTDRVSGPGAISPDGEQLAFTSFVDGRVRVLVSELDGAEARLFSETEVSSNDPLDWGPDSRILYGRMGSKNFHLLDPSSGADTPLVGEDELSGYMFNAKWSPAGDHVAVFWATDAGRGLWLIGLDGARRLLEPGIGRPIGWGDDGRIYYRIPGVAEIRAFDLDTGESERVVEFPFIPRDCLLVPGSEDRRFLCSANESLSDAWMIEDFDPEAGR